MSSVKYRPLLPGDRELLWEFLAIAAYEPTAESARNVPIVAAHLAGWPRDSDFGVIATMQEIPIGAAWARQFSVAEEPAYYVNERTPEISIGVSRAMRGKGVGEALLSRLIADARQRGVDLCLNVRDSNPALRLYERVGFVRVQGSDVPNRVGGVSFGMLLKLS